MRINKIIICVLISLLSLCALSTKGQQESIIVGSGFLKDDLIYPYSIQVTNSKIFLLDLNWIKVFDKKTNRFLKQIDLRKYCQNDDPVDWKDLFLSDLMGGNYYNLLPNQFSIPPSWEEKYWHSIYLDDKENCIILGEGYIYIIDSNSENLLKTIDLFTILPKLSKTNLFQVSMCVVDNYIYILYKRACDTAFYEEYEFYIFQISFNGICHKKILLKNRDLELKVNKFAFLSDLQLFLIPNETPYRTKKEEKLELVFFNQEGQMVPFNQGNQYIDIEQIANLSPNYFAIYGRVISKDLLTIQGVIKKFHYSYSSTNEIIIKENYSIDVSEFYVLDLKSYLDDFYLITKTKRFIPTIFKINQFEESIILESEKTQGQIFSSFGFMLDNQLHLIQSNIGNQMINWFSLNGDFINSLKLDFYIRDIEFDEQNHLFILSESYIEDQIFTFDENNGITLLFDNQILKKIRPYKIINLYCNNNDLYALIQIKDPKYYYEPGVIPIIYLLVGKKNQINEYEWNLKRLDYPLKIKKTFPITLDFKISDNKYVFLDSENSCLYLYDMTTGDFKKTIHLPTQENSLYTSLSLYSDGTYLLTDILQSCLIHVDQEGRLLETIGSKGQVEIGTSKEAYLEKSDQFYLPIRVKIANNKIYVSDFGNCRYHIIPIEPLTMTWQEESINMESISIFGNESGALHYETSISSVLPYQVTSTVPWIAILTPEGTLGDKKIDYQFLGEQLIPWKLNIGEIQITFPGYVFSEPYYPGYRLCCWFHS